MSVIITNANVRSYLDRGNGNPLKAVEESRRDYQRGFLTQKEWIAISRKLLEMAR